ncbi:MAG TPA: hypothetical protein VGA67_01520 [Candidatus Dojkabacteria bacterium]|jgi:hypothetical protein
MAKKSFNILRPQLSPPTAWDKIYQWMVGTARIVIIVVEIIVVFAFGIRVVVDTIGKNLDKQIVQKDAALNAYAPSEAEFRSVQNKTDAYRGLWVNSSGNFKLVQYLRTLLDQYSGAISFQINPQSVSISGELFSNEIKAIEQAMKSRDLINDNSDPLFSSVELPSIESEGDESNPLTTFSISARLLFEVEKRQLGI